MRAPVQARARMLNKVYQGDVPADLGDLFLRCSWLKRTISSEPALLMLMCQLKYGPWRDAVMRSWSEKSRGAGVSESLSTRAARLVSVLRQAAVTISATKVPRTWLRHAGRFVGRHSGGEQVLRHLGIIEVAKKGGKLTFWADADDTDDDDVCDDGDGDGTDECTVWKLSDKQAGLEKMRRLLQGWDAIWVCLGDAPRTCDEWYDKQHAARQALRNLKFKVARFSKF